jgi:predicted amino acid racemase
VPGRLARGIPAALGKTAMTRPFVTFDVAKIEHNARSIVRLCAEHGIDVVGVTKGTCGHPDVAKAMLRGGVSSIGESRMENIRRLRSAGVETSYMLLRIPPLSEVDEVVQSVDVSLNSELPVLVGLSEAACRRGRVHDVIIMIDLGDLREGILPAELVPFVRDALRLRGIRVVGVGTNLTCFGGIVPSARNMSELVNCANEIERTFGLKLTWISGANSSALELIASGSMPKRMNQARIGEGILLGRETVHRKPWPGTLQDAFLLHAEVLELKEKPSVPIGERGEDAFGRTPEFVDRGDIERAILNVGREDVDVEGMIPVDPRVAILGASSDYVILDVSRAEHRVRVGDTLAFSLNYGALLAAMTSEYVEKRSISGSLPVRGVS